MFEFINELKKQGDEEKFEKFDVSKNIVFNPNAFKEILYNMDRYSSQEIIDTIRSSYHLIFTDRFMVENPMHIALMTDHRFLTAAVRVLSTLPEIDYNIVIYCNKLAYDYIHSHITDEFSDTRNMFYSLARIVNKKNIQTLLAMGLSEDIAVDIVMARYSAINESVNIVRLHSVLANIDPNTMDIQMVVNIFEKLFDELSLLFQMIMFTPLSNREFEETYDNIGLAILFMINNMPSIAIRKVLVGYTTAYESGVFKQQYRDNNGNLIKGETFRRYNLEQLDYRFSRITGMIAMLKEEQIYVP